MKILITGVNGLIAKPLIDALLEHSPHQIAALSTHLEQAQARYSYIQSERFSLLSFDDEVDDIDIVINLAGEPIAKKFLTKKRLAYIKSQRLNFLHRLKSFLKQCKIKYFYQASASDIYGDSNAELTENDNITTSELAKICISQEFSAKELFEHYTTEVVVMRFGIVLHKDAIIVKALQNFLPLLITGNRTYLPYIALEDVVFAIMHLIEQGQAGIFNFTSPHYLSLRDLVLCVNAKRKCQLKMLVPSFVFKLIDKRAALLLSNKKVKPEALLQCNYTFHIQNEEDLAKYLH